MAKDVPIDPRFRSVAMLVERCGATPGTKVASCAKVRPFSGSSFKALESSVVPTTAASVWRAVAVAETSVTSLIAPNFMRKSTRTVSAARTSTLLTSAAWKLWCSAFIVYAPLMR